MTDPESVEEVVDKMEATAWWRYSIGHSQTSTELWTWVNRLRKALEGER